MRDADDDFVSLDYEDDNEVKDKDEQKHKDNDKDKVKVNDRDKDNDKDAKANLVPLEEELYLRTWLLSGHCSLGERGHRMKAPALGAGAGHNARWPRVSLASLGKADILSTHVSYGLVTPQYKIYLLKSNYVSNTHHFYAVYPIICTLILQDRLVFFTSLDNHSAPKDQ